MSWQGGQKWENSLLLSSKLPIFAFVPEILLKICCVHWRELLVTPNEMVPLCRTTLEGNKSWEVLVLATRHAVTSATCQMGVFQVVSESRYNLPSFIRIATLDLNNRTAFRLGSSLSTHWPISSWSSLSNRQVTCAWKAYKCYIPLGSASGTQPSSKYLLLTNFWPGSICPVCAPWALNYYFFIKACKTSRWWN